MYLGRVVCLEKCEMIASKVILVICIKSEFVNVVDFKAWEQNGDDGNQQQHQRAGHSASGL